MFSTILVERQLSGGKLGNQYGAGIAQNPSITLPHGFDERGHPTGLTFIGRLFGEPEMLALAKAYQDSTAWHVKHPML